MTKRNTYGLYALALAVVVVGALALGVPMGAIGLVVITLACPLTMFVAMRGMHGNDGMHHGHDASIAPQADDEQDVLRRHGRLTGAGRR